jgi:hypothetical protein
MTNADAIAEYFDELTSRGHAPMLEKVTATLRFDVVNGKRTERWLLRVEKGDLEVSRRNIAADAVFRAERPLFERVFSGKANPVAAFLRGELFVEGRPELIVLFQRLVPRPGDARTKGVTAGYARRQR